MILTYILIVLFIILDVVTKLIFSNIFSVGEMKVMIDNVLVFGYVQNTGASFGMLEGQSVIFFIATIVALTLFGYLLSKSDIKHKKVYTISLILLIGGTLGNAIDRMFYGYVIDFIQIPFLPIVGNTFFNVADMGLNFGVILMVIDMLFLERKRLKVENEQNHSNQSESDAS
jgi:signal peptidase II